ncbi:MAG: response regulator, partial [Dehalococcoidia bacterium]|nr:response regulator [Dehalococcoidia bacterium]
MVETNGSSREVAELRDLLFRLSDASLRINESLDFDSVLQGVLDSARSLTGARYGVIALRDDRGRPQDFLSSGMTEEEARLLWDTPDGLQLFEYLGGGHEPLRLPDLLSHVRTLGLREFRVPLPVGASMSFLGAPVLHQGECVGNIYVAEKEEEQEFAAEDEKTLVMFASQAAMVIANARRHRDEQRARADLESLINTAPVGVVLFDAGTGVPVSINREARRIVGSLHGRDETAEQALEVLTVRRADGREVSLEKAPLARTLQSGEAVRAEEIVLQVPDGRSVTTLINATPIRSERGDVESVVVTLQDMTPLEEIGRLRAEFLAMVSHELRQPLVAIKGSAATVLGGSSTFGPAEMVQFFHIIDRQADHMSGLINDLLDVARLETGTLPVNPEPVLVAAVVDQARSDFLSGGRGHDIRIDLPPHLPRVMADPRRVVQVLGNLLSNAARHSPEGSPIGISASHEDFHVAVSIKDQGSGFAAEQITGLFRKPSRIEAADQGGTTGLGLAISKGIVEAHGGRIWAQSDGPGRGARFTFTVPVVEEAATGTASALARTGPSSGSPASKQARILAVDDDPQALRFLHDTLSRAGYQPVVTGDPEEALRLMEASEPHLALLDLVLPGTDGIDLMKDIRAIANIPVIFLSAYGQEDVVAQAFDMGADDYVVKPFSPTELAARIRAGLRKRTAFGPGEPVEPYVCGDLVVDYAERRVSVAGHPVRLTAIEYRLLVELSANAGRTLTYDHLLERVWDRRSDGDVRPMRSAVRSLRRKLGDDANDPTYLFTESRVGYRFASSEGQGGW